MGGGDQRLDEAAVGRVLPLQIDQAFPGEIGEKSRAPVASIKRGLIALVGGVLGPEGEADHHQVAKQKIIPASPMLDGDAIRKDTKRRILRIGLGAVGIAGKRDVRHARFMAGG